MSQGCSIKAHVLNSAGEVVESNLFNDLLNFTENNREVTKQYYAIGTDSSFLGALGDKAVYDENGEITFQSLTENTPLKVAEVVLINGLNKELKAGSYSYEEAMAKTKVFNDTNRQKTKYLATIQAEEGGTFYIETVEKNEKNLKALEKQIHNKVLKDSLEKLLTSHGMDTSFLTDSNSVLYSTENIADIVDGVYQMLKVRDGVKISEEFAVKAGRIILETIKNSPLVDRLVSSMTALMQKEVLGDAFENDTIPESAKKELAAVALGKIISNKMSSTFSLTNLVNRIILLAKQSFRNMTREELVLAGLLARQLAAKITGNEFVNTVISAVESKTDKKVSPNITRYKRNIVLIKRLSKRLKDINSLDFKKIDGILDAVLSGAKFNLVSGELADALALEGLVQMVDYLTDTFIDISEKLAAIDYKNLSFLDSKFSEYAQTLREAKIYEEEVNKIIRQIQQGEESLLTGDTSRIPLFNNLGEVEYKSLMGITTLLKNLIDGGSENSFKLTIENAEFALNVHLLLNFYGKDYIELVARKTYGAYTDLVNSDGKVMARINKKTGAPLKDKQGRTVNVKTILHNTRGNKNQTVKVTFEELLQVAPRDLGFLERWITPLLASPDNVLLITDSLIKLANRQREEKTMEASRYLHYLKLQMKELGLDKQADLYEISLKTGLRTHNFVTPSCWADYEQDYKDFRAEAQSKFIDLLDSTNKTKLLILAEFFKFLTPLEKIFHAEHSIYDRTDKRMLPNAKYDNPQYDKLFGDNKALEKKYQELLEYKKNVDETFLPQNSSIAIRAPQIRNTVWQSLKNEIGKDGLIMGSYITFKGRIERLIGVSSEDRDFGSKLTDNELADLDFIDFQDLLDDAPSRIPLYGINPIANTAELSEDIFGSLLIYSDMAHSHYAMNAIRSPLEILGEVLKRRHDKQDRPTTQLNKRYKAMMDKHVFGVGVYRVPFGKLVLNKISSGIVSGGSILFLGANTTGGMVNVTIGAGMILNEAWAGLEFGVKDIARANKLYFENLVPMLADWGSPYPTNKLSLFMDFMDTQNRFGQNLRSYETNKSRVRNLFSLDLVFLPYSMGDHYMQGIPFLATATKLKVVLPDGTQISFLDALQKEDFAPGETGSTKMLKLPDLLFKSEEGRVEYYKLQTLINKLQHSTTLKLSSAGLASALTLTPGEEKYLIDKELGYLTTQAVENTITKLLNNAEELTWTTKDTAIFIKKNKDVTARLHGLMNGADKTEVQLNIMGQLISSLKSYAYGYYLYQFGSQHENTTLGHDVEGMKVTMVKLLNYLSPFHGEGKGTKLNLLKIAIYTMFAPNSKHTAKYLKAFEDAHFSESQFRNVKRLGMEIYIITFLQLLHYISGLMRPGQLGDDDDDLYADLGLEDIDELKEKAINPSEIDWWGFVYYMTGRNLQERMAWTGFNPKLTSNEMAGLVSIIPPAFSAMVMVSDLIYKTWGGLHYQYVDPVEYKEINGEDISDEQKEINKTFFEGTNKYHRRKGDPKYKLDFARMTYDRWSAVFYDGWNSFDSYEYAQGVRTR